ncbi:MAG: hypothetical protein R3B91_14090 [Planctomycetaceae bacterium]
MPTHRVSAEITDDGTELSLRQADDTRITYSCTGDGINRSDATERDEDFHLPFGESRFELSGAGRLITCRHERDPTLEMSFSNPMKRPHNPAASTASTPHC